MGDVPVAAATGARPLLLTQAQAAHLEAYARTRGMSEEEVVSQALDLLWRLTGERETEEQLWGGAGLPDCDVEIPIAFEMPPRAVVRMDATVVRCEGGVFLAPSEGSLLEPDVPAEDA